MAWARALWREPVHERRTAAVEILRAAAPRLAAAGHTIQVWNRFRQSALFAGQPWSLRCFDQIEWYPVSAEAEFIRPTCQPPD